MTPSSYKSKLPGFLSYPLGFQEICNTLEGAPHTDAMSLRFSDSPTWPASRFRRILADRSPYRILQVNYQPAKKPGMSAANFMIDRGEYDEKWEMIVYAVERSRRLVAHDLLIERGMPRVRDWLMASNTKGWDIAPRWIGLIFDPAQASLVVEEGEPFSRR